MPSKISKTQYMMGLQCPKRLWLYRNRRDLLLPPPPATQRIFDEGKAVDELARKLFPGGVLVGHPPALLHLAVRETAELVKEGPLFIFEGAFAAGQAQVRCDVLERNYDDTWDLTEVKSSSETHAAHVADAAMQRWTLEACGLKLNKVWLMHLDPGYVRQGPLDPAKLFKKDDITAATRRLLPEVERNIPDFARAAAAPEMPERPIGRHCGEPYDCEFRHFCWKNLPDYSIYDIPRLTWEKKNHLRLLGALKFTDVPDDFDLSPAQRLYLRVERSGEPAVDRKKINAFLKGLRYPLYYIDFETLQPGLPLYDNSRPYQQIPFQMSLHVQEVPGGPLAHHEYLGDPAGDPRPGLIAALKKLIGRAGTLVAYNSGFEAARIKELARDFPNNRSLLNLTERFADLLEPFQKQYYVHPAFKGHCSIKTVLPALVPGMTYEGMAVSNGAAAQSAYDALVRNRLPPAEAKKVRADLLAYCGQDTLAMVEIMKKLYAEASDWRA